MTRWRSWLLAGALILTCWGPGRLRAQERDSEDTARALAMFEEAAHHYQRGEFGPAAELLRQAYVLYRNPTLLYNLARAAEGLGDLSAAIEAYEQYLEAAPEAPDREMVAVGCIIAALVLVGSVRVTWSFSAFTVLVYYALTNLAALRLPAEHRLYPRFVPALGLVCCLGLAFWVEPAVWLVGLAVVAAGLLWHRLARLISG